MYFGGLPKFNDLYPTDAALLFSIASYSITNRNNGEAEVNNSLL